MGLFKARRFARGVSLVAAVLLCLGLFLLPLTATGFEVPSALAMANSPRVDQEANGNGYPLNGPYLVVVSAEEAQDADKDPLNADLLSALLLVVCFGAIVGWLLASGRGQRAFHFVGLDHRPSLVTAAALLSEDRSFLGVFRL
jgi:hypothetical protein